MVTENDQQVNGFLSTIHLGITGHSGMSSSKVDKILRFASLFSEAANHPRAEYMRQYMKDRYHSKRKAIIDRLGGKCSRCGTKKGPFHLDHKDKTKKNMRASDLHSVNDAKFEQEIKSLQVLCEKCHREKTHDAWDYSTPKPRHGTYWMYRKHGCRCKKCVDANREYQKQQREKRKKKAEEEMIAKDNGQEIYLSDPLVEELMKSIRRTTQHLKGKAKSLEDDKDNEFDKGKLQKLRDFSGNLALLVNMILNRRGYSDEEKTKAIQDDV